MADTQVTLDIGGAVSASLSLITSVQNILTGSRSATIEIDNNTNLTLTYAGGHNSHGGWAKIPDLSIKPMSATVLGVQNQGGSIMTGAEGWVMYGADDSSLLFSVGWDNPYIGANSGSARLGLVRRVNIWCDSSSGTEIRKYHFDLSYFRIPVRSGQR
jgi:hypothetical protein